MADYNSPYTGAEIDAGIAKTEEILTLVQVYNGAPVNTGISINNIPVNPGTGDRTGVYDIIYTSSTTPVTEDATIVYISRIYIGAIGQVAKGSAVSEINISTDMVNEVNVDYNLDSSSEAFTVNMKRYDIINNTATNEAYYIHKIFRLEKIV